jgi:hypothetical protein
VSAVFSQTPRTVKGAAKVEDFRPIGDRRVWTFVSRDSALGQLASGVEGKASVDGVDAIKIVGGLRVDFRRMGGQAVIGVQTEYLVSERGEFLENKLTFPTQDGKSEEFRFAKNSSKLKGYFTRGGSKVDQTVDWPRAYYALDGNFVDQLELYLASRDLTEGAYIRDTLFVPQLLSFAPATAQVGGVEWRELWRGRFDTVVGVHFTEPQRMSAFMTLDHRLVRVDFPDQQYRVFQDVVQQPKKDNVQTVEPLPPTKIGWVGYVALAVDYVVFGVTAALFLLLLAFRAFKWQDSYVGLLFGAIVFGLVLLTQIPAQKWIVTHLLLPGLREGESLYLLGLLPALVGGALQECLKLLGIYAVQFHRQTPATKLLYVGAFVAAAFGVAEACYLIKPTPVMSWTIFERCIKIGFHVGSGVLLGIALESESAKRFGLIGGLIGLNTFIFYLPVFAQQAAISPGWLHFWMAAVAVVVVAGAVFMSQHFKPAVKKEIERPSDTVKP